jgi:hypothetical protein
LYCERAYFEVALSFSADWSELLLEPAAAPLELGLEG